MPSIPRRLASGIGKFSSAYFIKENKPPFDPSLKMLGNKTAADILEAKKAVIVDYNDCHNALDEYTTWYNNDYTVASLGQQLE